MDRFMKKWREKAANAEREKGKIKCPPTESKSEVIINTAKDNLDQVEVLEVGEARSEYQDSSDKETASTSTSTSSCSTSTASKLTSTGRKFQNNWTNKFPWLKQSSDKGGKAICSFCSQAVILNLPLPNDPHSIRSKDAFVIKGFETWSRAISAFNKHESSEFHQSAIRGLANREKPSVLEYLSKDKKKQMMEARTALEKIFTTVQFLAEQGLAFRGDGNDESSNFIGALKMRAKDVPELQSWLNRSGSSYKWIHHKNVEEMLQLMANSILHKIVSEINEAGIFAIIIDETSDVARLEQVSMSIRWVSKDLEVHESFIGFYETTNTKSETLFSIVKDVLLRFGLEIKNLRGQCFDGASNVKGHLSGLQARLKEEEPRAIFVHCVAHRLNLVVQDALENIFFVREFIGVVKDMINFVRDSPKRLNEFRALQETNAPQLSKFCPTRWCMRIKSLRTILLNYKALINFFMDIAECKNACATAAAMGYLRRMESFNFYFYLQVLITIFDQVEAVNGELQASQLSVHESHSKINALKLYIQSLRDGGFPDLWIKISAEARSLELGTPTIPVVRKAPRRIESDSTPHIFESPEKYFQRQFFEILDVTLTTLCSRFESDTLYFLNSIEDFVTKKHDSAEIITTFYNINSVEFDGDRLTLHRNMLLDIMQGRAMRQPTTLMQVVEFLRANASIADMLPEITKLLKTVLTIPMSSCTAERSFSALRRLKNYLRSTMRQDRLNHITILHVHKLYSKSLDLKPIINEWISKCSVRSSHFAKFDLPNK